MARPITPGDEIPVGPPLRVLAVGKRIDGRIEVTVDMPNDHPAAAGLVANALRGTTLEQVATGLIGHPGLPEDDQ